MRREEEAVITTELLKEATDYASYNHLILDLLEKGTTTNGDSRESTLAYTKMNIQRTARWQKRGELTGEVTDQLKSFPYKMIWLVLTEGWCGDAAQSLPFIDKMANASPNIELKLILRDQHPEVMDAFLTNGSRSIPKLIAIKADGMEILGTWGPRPAEAQKTFLSQKDNPEIGVQKAMEKLHLWYARDKGRSLMSEFAELLRSWR